MRKLIAVSLILLVVLGACAKKPAMTSPPIPDNALIYAKFEALQTTWEEFMKTQLYQEMVKLDLWKDPFFEQIITGAQSQWDTSVGKSNLPLNKDTFFLLFGKRVDIALLPAKEDPQLILISDLGIQASVVKATDAIQQFFSDEKMETEKAGDIEIRKVATKTGETIAYYFVDHFVVFASHPDAAHLCLDTMNGQKAKLLDSQKYKDCASKDDAYKNTLYLDIRNLIATLSGGADDAAISSVNSDVESAFIGFDLSIKGLTGASSALYSKDSQLKNLFDKPQLAEKASGWIPEKPLIASGGSVKISEFISYQKANIEKNQSKEAAEEWNKKIAELNDFLGVDVEKELKEWAGSGMFFSIQALNSQGMFPVPDAMIGMAVKDETKARDFMRRIEGKLTAAYAESHFQFESVDVGKNDFRFVALPTGPNLAPGYSISNGFLLIATSQTVFANALHAQSGDQPSFLKSEQFKVLQTGDKDKTIGFQYFDSEQFWKNISDLVNNYRMFFPESVNPDHVRKALQTLGLIQFYYSDATFESDRLAGKITLQIK